MLELDITAIPKLAKEILTIFMPFYRKLYSHGTV